MASINFEFLHDDDDSDRKEEDSEGNQGKIVAIYLCHTVICLSYSLLNRQISLLNNRSWIFARTPLLSSEKG